MITVEYMGLSDSGKTVKEAKQKIACKVSRFIAAATCPRIIKHKGCILILTLQDVNSYCYTIVWPDSPEGYINSCSCASGTMKDGEIAGKKHIEQMIGQ